MEASRLFKFISLSLREIVCLDIFMPRLALDLLELAVSVANRSFFIHYQSILFSLAVVFLSLPSGLLALHDSVSSSFLKILWITLLDFPTVFEISPIESLSSLRNLTISFLSSNDVTPRSGHTKEFKKWWLIPLCLTLRIIKYVSRLRWSNPGKGVAPSPTPRWGSYWKGSLQVTLDYGRQLYFTCNARAGEEPVLFSKIPYFIFLP